MRAVESTAYSLTSSTASGHPVGSGVVAMDGVPFGSQWKVLNGPMAGRVFTVWDRTDGKTGFDIWMASEAACKQYGRQTIQIEQVG